ncbi:MAG: hypothetical protein GX825_08800 [Syntrophomonadaceae bacterium]|nr:hypothetical protein [Syntrophomonadaceae bacterium]
MELKLKKSVTEPRKGNVAVVYTGGDGIQSAYDILAKILLDKKIEIDKKLKEEEKECERRSMPG